MNRYRPLRRVSTAALLIGLLGGATSLAEEPTFNRDVAPLLFAHCTPCHRPGEAAPFPLVTYRDTQRFGKQITIVTRSRFMPPWLPAPGPHRFADERRLDPEQIATLRRWVEAGMPEGDPADLPAVPTWTEGWQVGQPDRVVTLSEPFTVPAGGTDVFRNFVIPSGATEQHFVKAVEIRPGNPRVAHHAILRIDRTLGSRVLDEADVGLGFGGMDMGGSQAPDGQSVVWAPGKVPDGGRDGIAWRLSPGTDLVLQLHTQPSGKEEQVQPSIGLFYADEPPRYHVFEMMLRNRVIDIPAGEANYLVEDRYTIPVGIQVLSVMPHAHYLGRDLRGDAVLPDGRRISLIHIPDWNFDWQDRYRYEQPVHLPAGTTIEMLFVYDNSAANPRNPNHPPQRVQDGSRSVDEMGTLTLEVLPDDQLQLQELRESLMRQDLEKDPDDWLALYNLGAAVHARGEFAEAIRLYEKSLSLNSNRTDTYVNLGSALQSQGETEEALAVLSGAVERDPTHAQARTNLGLLLQSEGRFVDAMPHLQRALELDPYSTEARFGIGSILLAIGKPAEAAAQFQAALRSDPEDAELHNNLGSALAQLEQIPLARRHLEQAVRLDPGLAGAHLNLANLLAWVGELDAAIEQYRLTLALEPESADALQNLELARSMKAELDQTRAFYDQSIQRMRQAEQYAARGAFDDALRLGNEALELAQAAKMPELIASIQQRLKVYEQAKP